MDAKTRKMANQASEFFAPEGNSGRRGESRSAARWPYFFFKINILFAGRLAPGGINGKCGVVYRSQVDEICLFVQSKI